jgi:hypothetical protein
VYEVAKANPKRMVFAEAEEEVVLRAAIQYRDFGYGQPILVGPRSSDRLSVNIGSAPLGKRACCLRSELHITMPGSRVVSETAISCPKLLEKSRESQPYSTASSGKVQLVAWSIEQSLCWVP